MPLISDKELPMNRTERRSSYQALETPAAASEEPTFFGGMFRAFSYSQFRLLWAGAFTSSVGSWMQ